MTRQTCTAVTDITLGLDRLVTWLQMRTRLWQIGAVITMNAHRGIFKGSGTDTIVAGFGMGQLPSWLHFAEPDRLHHTVQYLALMGRLGQPSR